ncbi:hypothetical protein niasHT_035664 [Heterodera trifolii]|uniref:Uncharacterized protein n=1 Tax=Heterodera trifolii TaxID=157864 RepID=A0ABD2J345_9BILA
MWSLASSRGASSSSSILHVYVIAVIKQPTKNTGLHTRIAQRIWRRDNSSGSGTGGASASGEGSGRERLPPQPHQRKSNNNNTKSNCNNNSNNVAGCGSGSGSKTSAVAATAAMAHGGDHNNGTDNERRKAQDKRKRSAHSTSGGGNCLTRRGNSAWRFIASKSVIPLSRSSSHSRPHSSTIYHLNLIIHSFQFVYIFTKFPLLSAWRDAELAHFASGIFAWVGWSSRALASPASEQNANDELNISKKKHYANKRTHSKGTKKDGQGGHHEELAKLTWTDEGLCGGGTHPSSMNGTET